MGEHIRKNWSNEEFRHIENRFEKFGHIRRKWRDKQWWKLMFLSYAGKLLFQNNGSYVMDEDFDHLIILDACRYDCLKKLWDGTGYEEDFQYRISKGSNTFEWIYYNFVRGVYADSIFNDIIYVTANPWVKIYLCRRFHKIIDVYDHKLENTDYCSPAETYNCVRKTLIKHPNKRYIIHFLQPHDPMIRDGITAAQLRRGEVTLEEYIESYEDNIDRAIPFVKKLADRLGGKIVVTADHGEAFGEPFHRLIPKPVYSHHKYIHIEPLVKVPWLIINKRKTRESR